MAVTKQPIIFLSPKKLEGQLGFQLVDDESHEVAGVVLGDGTPVTRGCSYKSTEADDPDA